MLEQHPLSADLATMGTRPTLLHSLILIRRLTDNAVL